MSRGSLVVAVPMVRHSLGFSSRLCGCSWNYTIVCLHLSRLLCFVHIHGMRVCSWVFVFLCSHLYALLFGSFHLSHRSHSSVVLGFACGLCVVCSQSTYLFAAVVLTCAGCCVVTFSSHLWIHLEWHYLVELLFLAS